MVMVAVEQPLSRGASESVDQQRPVFVGAA